MNTISKFASVLTLMTFTMVSLAEENKSYQYKYDPSTGNAYSISKFGNTTRVQGNNLGTGSTWSVNQDSNGSYNGTDASGNYFTGNNKTGYYNNLGTGKMCTGTGYGRICN